MGWTGGQYSLYRGALATAVGCELIASARVIAIGATSSESSISAGQGALLAASSSNPIALALLAAGFLIASLLVVALAAGFRDRIAAQLLAPFIVFAELAARTPNAMSGGLDAAYDALAGRTALLPALLLLLHARVPAAPFGAFDARERTDPRGGWQRPAVQTAIGWGLLVLAMAARLFIVLRADDESFAGIGGFARAAAGFELAVASIGLAATGTRPAMWGVLALFGIAWFAAGGVGSGDFARQALLLGFACEPAWWGGLRLAAARADREDPAARSSNADAALPARLFYDGDCGFCHRSVRFILSEELATPAALRLRFAPLGSDTFRACLARHPELDETSLPDSIVLELEDGVILTRSAAALEIASRLGGFWRLLALLGRIVPRPLLDAGYDGIARIRKRLFARPKDACPILPPDLRARFDA